MNHPRVVEIGAGIGAAWASRLLADEGADVVKVEPTEGDPTRARGPFPKDKPHPEHSGLFLALNANKRGVAINLIEEREQLNSLIAWADILVLSLQPTQAIDLGLDAATLTSARPDLVILSVTPFGMSGPYADLAATELIVHNAGGWASMCPMTHPSDTSLAPLKNHGHQCALMSGIAAAMTALAVYRSTRETGQGDYIDFSEQDYVAGVLEFGVCAFSYSGVLMSRLSPRGLNPWRFFEAKDGQIFLVCIEQDQWERLVQFMGNPEWATDERFQTPSARRENVELLNTHLETFVRDWNVMDLYHEAQKSRICMAPVMTFAQLDENDHLADRRLFTEVQIDGLGTTRMMQSAAMYNGQRRPIERAAPKLGEHNGMLESLPPKVVLSSLTQDVVKPLSDIRVLDMTWVWAGPFAGMNLAHLGADVIRLESEGRLDLYRRGAGPNFNQASMFNQWNLGKRSMALDLRQDRAREMVKDLVSTVDVLVQNFATGVMDRLGLGYDVLKEINPNLVMASISGYGQSGPYREYMGYGPASSPLSGLSSATGYVGGAPEEMGLAMPDPTAGITAALAVVSALLERDTTGKGQHIDVTLWEATTVLGLEGWMQHAMNGTQADRIGNRDPHMCPHGVFHCAGDDEWVAIACRNDADWRVLSEVIDGLDHADFATFELRKANEDALESAIGAWTATRDRWDIAARLQGRKVPAMPTLNCAEVLGDVHMNERGFIEFLEHPEVGVKGYTGIPWRLHHRPNGVDRPAPCLGEHTDAVLREILIYPDDEIEALREAGLFY